jgi:hypothetical protein
MNLLRDTEMKEKGLCSALPPLSHVQYFIRCIEKFINYFIEEQIEIDNNLYR